MSDLKIALPILSQSIGSESVNAVNARDLHRELEVVNEWLDIGCMKPECPSCGSPRSDLTCTYVCGAVYCPDTNQYSSNELCSKKFELKLMKDMDNAIKYIQRALRYHGYKPSKPSKP